MDNLLGQSQTLSLQDCELESHITPLLCSDMKADDKEVQELGWLPDGLGARQSANLTDSRLNP